MENQSPDMRENVFTDYDEDYNELPNRGCAAAIVLVFVVIAVLLVMYY